MAEFQEARFGASSERCELFAAELLRLHAPDAAFEVLDVGCGTGDHLLALAEAYPNARLCGVDISGPNIEQARASAAAHGERARFVREDFLAWSHAPADVVISDSTLHLIAGDDEELARRLALALRPGGTLLFSMPEACLRNTLLLAARRLFRLLRCAPLDALLLQLARRAYGSSGLDDSALRDRIEYMYILPLRMFSPGFRSLLQRHGMAVEEVRREPQKYVAKPRHVFVRCRRAA